MKNYYLSYVTSPSRKIFAKVILLMVVVQNLLEIRCKTLSDPRQHKKCACSIFIILTSLCL